MMILPGGVCTAMKLQGKNDEIGFNVGKSILMEIPEMNSYPYSHEKY